MKTYKDLKELNVVCNDLDERSYYIILISHCEDNPVYKAILYTGFKGGGYRAIHSRNDAYPPSKTCRIQVLQKILGED